MGCGKPSPALPRPLQNSEHTQKRPTPRPGVPGLGQEMCRDASQAGPGGAAPLPLPAPGQEKPCHESGSIIPPSTWPHVLHSALHARVWVGFPDEILLVRLL